MAIIPRTGRTTMIAPHSMSECFAMTFVLKDYPMFGRRSVDVGGSLSRKQKKSGKSGKREVIGR